MFRVSLIAIALLSAMIALVYRYGLGVRVIRSKFPRSKLREDFDYNLWSKILGRYVSPKSGRVNYHGLRKRRELLEEFVAMLAVFGPNSTPHLFNTKMEQMAYWINAYNALVLFAVVELFPVDSILDIRTGFCCCSSSDYHLYCQQRAKERKKRKKLREKLKKQWESKRNLNKNGKKGGGSCSSSSCHSNGHHQNGRGRRRRTNGEVFGGINIKYNLKKHQLLIEDQDHDQIICISNEKKRAQMRAKRARKAESRKKLKRSYWFFEALRFEVDGQLYSLREIERDIIVHKFGDHDARILCCLNKGCVGSPKLSNKPFEAHRLNQQLNEQNRLLCSGAVKRKDLSLIGHNICVSGIFRHFKAQYIKYAKKNQWIIDPSNRHVECYHTVSPHYDRFIIRFVLYIDL